MKLGAIIWDYDGTLVDTRKKNLNVSRAVVAEVAGSSAGYPALMSLEAYEQANRRSSNWRSMYRDEFGFSEDQIDQAGRLWTPFQQKDRTEVHLFPAITETVAALGKYRQAIVSQNSSQIIRDRLTHHQLESFFESIVGYEEVGLSRQKPHPDGLLFSISRVAQRQEDDLVFYIGDHETDMQCADEANKVLGRKAVLTIGALYEKPDDSDRWAVKPDYKAHHVHDLVSIVQSFTSSF